MAPVNDNFANRIRFVPSSTDAEVSNVTLSATTFGTNVGSTGEPGEPNHAGVNFNNTDSVNSVWYTLQAPVSGLIAINTFGSNYDTSLGVYTGSAVNSLTTIGGNDDFSGLQSQVQFNATAGTPYQIAVDGFSFATGNFQLNAIIPINFTQTGTVGNDNLNGSNLNDVISGLGGDDNINGNGGNDALFGGSGNDIISAGSGNDYLDGGTGNDIIYGNGGNDIILGGDGNNLIYGGSGADTILTGSGNDTIYANGGNDFINTGAGFDTVWLGSGSASVVLEAGSGFDSIQNFQLGQTTFVLGSNLSADNLTFADSANGVRISAGSDLLGVVSWNQASTFEANRNSIFV
jgi:Ca2+-binding RTX toxin-like protein